MDGECGNLVVNPDPRFMAFIPFFGGRPPGVQGPADNPGLKVHSIGQGNSLVSPHIKAMQTMATICSCLKYFGQATIGVSRDMDRDIINQQLDNLIVKSSGKPIRYYIHVSRRKLSYVKISLFVSSIRSKFSRYHVANKGGTTRPR